MNIYHEFDHAGKHYRLVYDEEYRVERSCSGGSACECDDEVMADDMLCEELQGKGTTKKQECEHWYRKEVEDLFRGETVALGCIVTEPCDGRIIRPDKTAPVGILRGHCTCCSGSHETNSLWGIVIENSTKAAEDYCKEAL